jgi:serpin B
MARKIKAISTLAVLLVAAAAAQENAGQALPDLIRGNERFGRKLLQQVHSTAPERNVVVAPLPLSILFGAIQAGVGYGKNTDEIENTFGWRGQYISLSARMILAAFSKPEQSCKPDGVLCLTPEGAWIDTTFLYHSTKQFPDPISPDFRHMAEKYFGITFVSLGEKNPSKPLAQAKSADVESNDFSVRVSTHLETAWRGNTFSMSTPYKGRFQPITGIEELTEMVNSELEMYLYAKTDSFEAVALPCWRAYMIAVLPAAGKDIHDLERELAENPEALDAALQRRVGFVSMPVFHIVFESDLHQSIKALGIRSAFIDLGSIIKIPESHLQQINQKVDIQVDKQGIRADAETVAGGVYGGIMAGQKPFHMELNRPFIFIIRDQVTNALLFMGAVMDPSKH